jgi:hypothetical protein
MNKDKEMEKGWLIESIKYYGGQKIYWTGAMYSGRYNGIDAWTTNAVDAVRFSRPVDAELCMTWQKIPKNEYQIREHQWE